MKVRWDKAWWVILFLFIFYSLAIYFTVGCAHDRPKDFENGDKIVITDVVDPDMPGYEKTQK